MTYNAYDIHVEESLLEQVTRRLRRYARDKAFAHNHPDLLRTLKRQRATYKRHIRNGRRSQNKAGWAGIGLAGAGL
jgi:hypothetical protein